MHASIERIWRRVLLVVGRGRATVVNDRGTVQRLQVNLGALELHDALPRLAEYGLTSVPPVGSDVVVLFVGGDRSNGVVVATGHQGSRKTDLSPGEVALYDDLGLSVHLTRTGIVIKGGGLPVKITDTNLITLDSDVAVTGALSVKKSISGSADITAAGDVSDQGGSKTMALMRKVFGGHHHGSSSGPDAQM